MLDGMNEHGLSVTYNLAASKDNPSVYAPLSLALQEMLETCKSTDEAINYIIEAKQGGHDALLMIADSEGTMKTVEISPKHHAIREPVEGLIINTNHYQTEEMMRHEIPRNAVRSEKASESLRGKKIFESSERRASE